MKVLIVLCLVAGALASCPANSKYKSCGTACPLTCDNYQNPPKACILMCNPGCHCDAGYVKTEDGQCVLPENCPNQSGSKQLLCSLPPETGMCRGYFPRYHFDAASGQCKEFIYGGCGGNENNFDSEEECKNACGRKAVCGVNERYNGCGTACPLTCENYANPPKFCTKNCVIGCECAKGYVKSADGRCVLPEECPARAFDRSECEKAPETGRCMAYFRRFYYDQEAGQCKRFVYGGCGGNKNNFLTEDECYNKCGALSAPSACNEEKAEGPCMAYFQRYFFNKQTGQCEKFIYGGCQGNSNNFETQDDCEAVCLA